jgi:hypothetical protein
MLAKLLEIRDAATFIPVLAIQFGSENEAERYLAARAGYGCTIDDQKLYVFLCKIDGDGAGGTYDPQGWPGGARTMLIAHRFIVAHFDELEPGAVVDVEHILGETEKPKQSERLSDASRRRVWDLVSSQNSPAEPEPEEVKP